MLKLCHDLAGTVASLIQLLVVFSVRHIGFVILEILHCHFIAGLFRGRIFACGHGGQDG